MPSVWDWLTPWDTEAEREAAAQAERQRLAAQEASSADRVLIQRAQQPAYRDPLDDWAAAVQQQPTQGPQPKPDPWADVLNAFNPPEPTPPDPVQTWRQTYDVQPPEDLQVEYGFDPIDTSVPQVGASSPIAPTLSYGQRQGPEPKPPAAWGAFSNAFDKWALSPAQQLAQQSGMAGALENTSDFLSTDLPNWYTAQPAYQKAQADYDRAQAAGRGDVANAGAMALNQIFGIPGKAISNAPIPGSGQLLGLQGNVSAGDVLAAVGGGLNKYVNPFNPNQMSDTEALDVVNRGLEGQSFWQQFGIQGQLEKAVANRAAIAALPDQIRDAASLALATTISGADNVRTAIGQIVNQSQDVANLYALAEEAYQKGDPLAAAEYGRQAENLKNKTATEIVDDNTNIWAEVVEGILVDPLNAVGPVNQALGLTNEARAAAKNLALFNMSTEDATEVLDSAMPEVRKLAKQINIGEVANGLWARVNPFALTPDTAAHATSNNLFRTAATLFNEAATKQDAVQIVDQLITNPASLVAENKVGPGILANEDFLKDFPVLVAAQDALKGMRSLVGNGPFNAVEFLSEFDDIIYRTARRAQGLDDLAELPDGAKKLRLARGRDGTGIIQYIDKAGKVLGQSDEMVYYNAQQELKAMQRAMDGAGTGLPSAIRAHDQIQRAIMSDLWLNMRPAHWVRNALSATTTLLADDLYTLRPTQAIMEGLERRFRGPLPTQRLMEATGGVQDDLGAQSIFRKLGPLGTPLAALAEKGSKIWAGGTDIAGRVPFGEQNFYLRAFNQPFERFMDVNWRNVVSADFVQELAGLGLDDGLIQRLSNIATDAGITGSKGDVARAVREAVNLPTISPNLRELNIQPDSLSLSGWQEVNQLIRDGLPEQAGEIATRLRSIVGDEAERWLRLINVAPPQPARYQWTQLEQVQDGAGIIDSMVQAARRMGRNVQEAREEATQYVQRILTTERQALDTFRDEVAGLDNPAALNVAIDLWGRIDELKRVARGQVDALGQRATQENTPEAWAAKWDATRSLYDELSQSVATVIDEARADILSIEAGQDAPQRFDFWAVVQRYMNYDDQAVREARTAGLDLGTPTTDNAFREVIEANRSYVDMSMVEVMGAFRRYPSIDALDVVASAQRNIDRLGAQVAGYLADARDQLANGLMSKESYYGMRNTTWNQFFDNAVMVNKVAVWEIVQDGLARQTESALRWVDEFAGGEFKLIAPGENGVWLAKSTGDGSIHRFADPTRGDAARDMSSMPRVPQNVINDFYSVTGQAEKIIADAVEEITQEAATRYQIPRSLDEYMDMVRRGVEPPDEMLPENVLDEIASGSAPTSAALDEAEGLAAERAAAQKAGSREARAALRGEWDRVAKANGLANSIDQVIASYTRDGIVRVPEDAFEDLYGETVAGRTLSGQADVEAFLQEYYDTNMRRFDMAVDAVNLEDIFKRMSERAKAPFKLQSLKEGAFNPWGLLGNVDQDAREVFRLINEGVQNTGQATPEMGDAAHYMATNAQQAVELIIAQLPELLQGTPNAMTPAQKLRAIDAVNRLAAKHDDVLAAAVKTGQDVADFAMLNYNKRRNFDALLQLAIPYHYFWSRSAANWARRVAQKPAIANFYYETQRAIDAQNERDSIPQHLRGTIGVPGTEYRITNPLPYMLPFSMYGPSAFVDPNEAQTEAGRWINTVVQWGPGLLPTLDIARKALVEGDLSDVSLGDYLPQYKVGGYARQAVTGETMQGPLSYTDEYELGRVGKQVSLANVRGDISRNEALYAQDVGYQQATGAAPLPEQPEGATDIWRQGAKDSGLQRLITTGTGYLTGLGLYQYSPEEQQIRAISSTRRDLGYDRESNLYGSQGAINAFDQMTGDVTDPYYAYRQLYPSSNDTRPAPPTYPYQQNFKPERPGVQAVADEKKMAKGAIETEMNENLAAFIDANPDASNSDMYNFKKPYYDRMDALDEQFPSAPTYEEGGDFYRNYSPEELQARAQQSAVFAARKELAEMKPAYPGDNATSAQWAEYKKQRAAYDSALEARVQEYLDDPKLLSSLVFNRPADGQGPARPGQAFGPEPKATDWDSATPELFPEITAAGFTPEQVKPPDPGQGVAVNAAELIESVEQQNVSDAERVQREANADKSAAKQAAYDARRQQAVEMFGDDIWSIVDGYDKNWNKAEKRAYFEQYPQLSAFYDWWYGDDDDKKKPSSGEKNYQPRAVFLGGGAQEVRQPIRVNIDMPYSQGLSQGLAAPPQTGRRYQPSQVDLRWLQAARTNRPRERDVKWIRKGGGTYD